MPSTRRQPSVPSEIEAILNAPGDNRSLTKDIDRPPPIAAFAAPSHRFIVPFIGYRMRPREVYPVLLVAIVGIGVSVKALAIVVAVSQIHDHDKDDGLLKIRPSQF
jgi:hypothetical protein